MTRDEELKDAYAAGYHQAIINRPRDDGWEAYCKKHDIRPQVDGFKEKDKKNDNRATCV
jgi:hypothetical protein